MTDLYEILQAPPAGRRARPVAPGETRGAAVGLVAVLPRCIECGKTRGLNRHHRIPVRFGGSDHPRNLVWVCDKHHARRELMSRLVAQRLGLRDLYASPTLRAILRRHRLSRSVAPAVARNA